MRQPRPGKKLITSTTPATGFDSLGGNDSHPAPRALRMPEPARGAFLNLIGGNVSRDAAALAGLEHLPGRFFLPAFQWF